MNVKVTIKDDEKTIKRSSLQYVCKYNRAPYVPAKLQLSNITLRFGLNLWTTHLRKTRNLKIDPLVTFNYAVPPSKRISRFNGNGIWVTIHNAIERSSYIIV